MSKQHNFCKAIVAAVLCAMVAGCAHQTSPSAQINSGLAPFSSTRNQAVTLVASTKHSLGAEDLNTLAVAYTALQEKANAYADFMIEAVSASSFDTAKNAKYSADLGQAIAGFDRVFNQLAGGRRSTIAGEWVPSFAQTLQARWNQYSGYVATMPAQTKAELIADLKRETVWPNYEDIATEPVAITR